MGRKISEIKVMVEPETKHRLKQKADELGLSLTSFIERVANEPIVFLDNNVKRLIDNMGKLFPNKN